MLWNFIDKKYNLPAVNNHYTLLSLSCPECFRKLPGNFSGNFLSRDQLVTTEFTTMLHVKKIQFYGCKQVFYFDKSRKVPRGKLPPEKNPPENISANFGKLRKFFLTGDAFRKFRGKYHKILLIKSMIYRL
mgnify:CR=1 FL=1